MQSNHETLGDIIKSARQKADITIEDLASRVNITERYLYRIENEGKKPSFDVLYKLIRELSILPDSIFYPEKLTQDSEAENLVRMMYNCDERSMQIIKATIKAALDSQQKNRKEPMAVRFLTGSSALRLCVWLFDDKNMQFFRSDQALLFTFRAVERIID